MNRLPEYLKFETKKSDNKNTVICGDIRFTVVTERLIRIEQDVFYDEASLIVLDRSFKDVNFNKKQENGVLCIETEFLTLKYKIGEPLRFDTLSIRLNRKPYTEWHYGEKPLQNLGGTVETLDCINGECPIDDGICSIDGYYVLNDSETPLFAVDGWFTKRENSLDLYFFGYGHDYVECVKDYYRLTGKPEMLPAFTLGNWWSRYHKYTDKEYLDLMDEFKEKDIPFSVGIVDMDWHLTDGDGRKYYEEGWTGYTWNKKFFPDYKKFLKEIHNRNLKTALNLHPANGVAPHEELYPKMAEAMGVDPKSNKKVPFDCLNPEFLKNYFEILHFPYEKDGIDFWWMDWQQGTDYSWIKEEDKTNRELECINPLWLLNHFHYLAQKRNGERGLVFSRFAGFGSQRYPIGFSGDTIITWESLDFQVYFTVTASNIGYGWWSHDIGGHARGIRDDELNTRWIQFGVFSPIFRLHSTSDEFLGREPWNYGKGAEVVIKDFMQLRHKLFPYLYTMNHRNVDELIPLIQPMYHLYPEEAIAYKMKNQYFFGSELLVAPITEKNDNISGLGKAEVWLPEGKWIDFFCGYVYKGNQKLKVFRPLHQMPLFMKAGAIVPMQVHQENDNHLGNHKDLEIKIAAGADGKFTLYEDDGISLNYKNGSFAKTDLELCWNTDNATFKIGKTVGDKSLIPDKRNYSLMFCGFKNGCEFFVNGEKLNAQYVKKENTYIVNLQDVSTLVGSSVEIKNSNGILHDNSDCREKVSDALIHTQCDLHTKYRLIDLLEARLNKTMSNTKSFIADCDTHIAGYLLELESQL